MINPEDPVTFDLRSSIPEEEAVAKLIGWMQGNRRISNLVVTDDGIDPKQFEHIYCLPQPLDVLIRDEREFASIRFVNAAAAHDFGAAEKWEARVRYWDDIAIKAERYLSLIHQEFDRRNSKLVVDEQATARTGTRHITVNSLDRWSRITFGKEIRHFEETVALPTENNTCRPAPLSEQRCGRILELIRQLGHDPKALPHRQPGMPGIKSHITKLIEESPLFTAKRSFEKAWQTLRDRKEIQGDEQRVSPKINR